MAAIVLTNAAIYAGQADLSGRSNKVELNAESDEVDSTCFNSSGFRSYVGGLKQVTANVEGNFEALDATYPDERLFTDIGVASVPYSFSPTGGAVGDLAYFFRSTRADYSLGGSVGDLLGFTSNANASNSEGLIRGYVLNSAGTALTATGSGAQVLVQAASSTQTLYAALHVLSISGTAVPTLTMRVQSDTTGFPSATTNITFNAMTAIGSQWASLAGANTDTYYRANYTISGTNPSFLAVLVIGIV